MSARLAELDRRLLTLSRTLCSVRDAVDEIEAEVRRMQKERETRDFFAAAFYELGRTASSSAAALSTTVTTAVTSTTAADS